MRWLLIFLGAGLALGCAEFPGLSPEAFRVPLPPPTGVVANPTSDLEGTPVVETAPSRVDALPSVARKPSEISLAASAASTPTPTPTPTPAQTPIASESPAEYNLTCQEILNYIKASSSVEETLQKIKSNRPKFLSRAVFAYETKMPFDDATLVFPRPIVYGGDAKVIVAFSGRHRQRGFERMETICFNDQQNKFEFFDVIFPAEAASPEALQDLTADEKQMKSVVIAGGRDMRRCQRCHQESLRPNWDAHNLWPGFYGAVDDVLLDRERADARPIYNTFEYNYWQAFQSLPAKRKRYSFISPELKRPNADFTTRLSYLNGRRIVEDLKRTPEFREHRYEFAKALFCAPKAPRKVFAQLNGQVTNELQIGVLPEGADAETRDIFLSAYYDEMQRENRLGETLATLNIPSPLPKEKFEELRLYYRDLFHDKELNLDMRLSAVDVDQVLKMRELKRVTDKLGIDIESWSMVRDGGYLHDNGQPESIRLILERPFVNEFLSEDKVLSELIAARETSKICTELARRTH